MAIEVQPLKYGPIVRRDEYVEVTNLATHELRWRIAQILHQFVADGVKGDLRHAVDAILCAHLQPVAERR